MYDVRPASSKNKLKSRFKPTVSTVSSAKSSSTFLVCTTQCTLGLPYKMEIS